MKQRILKRNELGNKIKQLMIRLNGITNSDEAKDIKKEVKQHLRSIRKLFKDHGKATNGLFVLQKNMMKSFELLRKRDIEIDQLKRDVVSDLSRLDKLLDELDDKM